MKSNAGRHLAPERGPRRAAADAGRWPAFLIAKMKPVDFIKVYFDFQIPFAFQSNSEVVQPATRFHHLIPKFGTTRTYDLTDDSIPLNVADNVFNAHAKR